MGHKYIRYEVIPLAEFLADIGEHWSEPTARIQRPSGKWVGCTALRLKTFYRSSTEPDGLICVSCKLPATHFAVESSPGQVSVHVNLYGIRDGKEVLFTHDHILARGLGGADDLTNSQTMCSPCNGHKSKSEGKEANRRKILSMNIPKKLMTRYDYKVEHKEDGCYVTVIRLLDNSEQVFYMASNKGIGVMEQCMDSITDEQADEYFPTEKKGKLPKVAKVQVAANNVIKAPKALKVPKREHFLFQYKDGALHETGFTPEEIDQKLSAALTEYNNNLVEYNIKLEEYNLFKRMQLK